MRCRGMAISVVLSMLVLALAVPPGETLLFDIAVRATVHTWASPPLTFVMRMITHMGEPAVLVLLTLAVAVLWSVEHRARAARLLIFSTLGVVLLNEILKLVFHRPRPAAFFGYQEPSTYSFPSGHSVTSLCFYGVLAWILAARLPSRRSRAVLYTVAGVLVLLIGFSRVYLGVHYLTDVIGGYALGVAWLVGVGKISSQHQKL